jgi:MoaA/NifB/PqqE/SkfB family radical SAM enzyme
MSKAQKALSATENEKRESLQRDKPRVFQKVMQYADRIRKGQSIAILQFQYDYACNMHCQHCCITKLRRKGNQRCFTVKDIENLSRQADEMGLAHVVITGGEPLIFPDFDDVVRAFDPDKFYITSDTNGWYLDGKRAKHLKSIGVDKIQLSLDSLCAEEHDAFRRKKGAHERALRAIDASLDAGLALILSTVVTKQRVRSEEFIHYLEFAQKKGVGVFVTYAKPVGAWEGNHDILIDKEDMAYVSELGKRFDVFTHLTPAYGMDLGCIAVKRMVSLTKYGDVMPCPYIHTTLGNFFSEPLERIIRRGLNIKYFGEHVDTCLIAEDKNFIEKYEVDRINGNKLPVLFSSVFHTEDFIEPEAIM